jgi:hypothetical protein
VLYLKLVLTILVFFYPSKVVFERSYSSDLDGEQSRVERSVRDLERAGFWKTKNDVNCWNINNVIISQTNDGLVR